MASPRASVLMTVYNETAERLDRALGSIRSQSFSAWELILVDDGSTEAATRDCLERWAGEDARIRLVRTANQRPARASNHGLALVRTPLVFRHDSDDWSEPDRFARQIAFLDTHPEIALVGSAVSLHQEDGFHIGCRMYPATPREVREAFPVSNPFVHGAVCMRTEVIKAIGGYREELWLAPDYDFFWRFSEHGDCANLPEPLYHLVFRAGSVTADKARDRHRVREAIRLLAKSRRDGGEIPFEEALARATASDWSPAAAEAALGDDLLRAGALRGALRAYIAGLKATGAARDRLTVLAKLARLALYAALPRLRYLLFREKRRQIVRGSVTGDRRAANTDPRMDSAA